MCGRYTITESPNQLAARFRAALESGEFRPRYNAAPTQMLPVVIDEDGRKLQLMRWGLIPSWATDAAIGNKLINARAETVTSKPSFRSAFRQRRCLVPADGFYEWLKEGKTKLPYRIRPDAGGIVAFAGLWDTWKDDDGHDVRSFTIITTNATGPAQRLHDRMPLMLTPAGEDTWLDPAANESTLTSILNTTPNVQLSIQPVSPRVNSPQNDHPSLVEREATTLFPLE